MAEDQIKFRTSVLSSPETQPMFARGDAQKEAFKHADPKSDGFGSCLRSSALTGLEARVQLVDDVNAALAANQTVLAVTALERLERIFDLHFSDPQFRGKHSPGL
jgi:hypothetical protein